MATTQDFENINRIAVSRGSLNKFLRANHNGLSQGEFFYQLNKETFVDGTQTLELPANSLITRDPDGNYHVLSAEKFHFEGGNFEDLAKDIDKLQTLPIGTIYTNSSSKTLPDALIPALTTVSEDSTEVGTYDITSSPFVNLDVFLKDATANNKKYVWNTAAGDVITIVDGGEGVRKLLYIRSTTIFASNVLYKNGSLEEYLNNPITFGYTRDLDSITQGGQLHLNITKVGDIISAASKGVGEPTLIFKDVALTEDNFENTVIICRSEVILNGSKETLPAGSLIHCFKDAYDNFTVQALPFKINTNSVKSHFDSSSLTDFMKNVNLGEDERDDGFGKDIFSELKTLTGKTDANLTEAINYLAHRKADLDSNGKLPVSELPDSVVGGLNFKGVLKYDRFNDVNTLAELANVSGLLFDYVYNEISIGDALVNEIAKTDYEDLKKFAERFTTATDDSLSEEEFIAAVLDSDNKDAVLSKPYYTIDKLAKSIIIPYCGKNTKPAANNPIFSSIATVPGVGDTYQYLGPTIDVVCEETKDSHTITLRYGCKLIYSGPVDDGTKGKDPSVVDNFWSVVYDNVGGSSIANVDGEHYNSLETIEFLKRYISGNAKDVIGATKVDEKTTLFKLDNHLAYIDEETVNADYLPKFGPDFSLKQSKIRVAESTEADDLNYTEVGSQSIVVDGKEIKKSIQKKVDKSTSEVIINDTLSIINRSAAIQHGYNVYQIVNDKTEGEPTLEMSLKENITEVSFRWGAGTETRELVLPRYSFKSEETYSANPLVNEKTICTQAYAQYLIEEKLKGSLKGEEDVAVTYNGSNELHESSIKITAKGKSEAVGFDADNTIAKGRREDLGETVDRSDEATLIKNNNVGKRFGFKDGDIVNILPKNNGILLNSSSVIDGGLWI